MQPVRPATGPKGRDLGPRRAPLTETLDSASEWLVSDVRVVTIDGDDIGVEDDAGSAYVVPATEWGEGPAPTPGARARVLPLVSAGPEPRLASARRARRVDRLAALPDLQTIEIEIIDQTTATWDGMRLAVLRATGPVVPGTVHSIDASAISPARNSIDVHRAPEWKAYKVGSEVTVRVVGRVPYGLFVTDGTIGGLVHVSELGRRPRDPLTDFEVGDEFVAVVIAVDAAREKISFSRRQALPTAYAEARERLHIGDWVEGTVTSIVDFGAFVSLDCTEGLDGLLHYSEIPEAGHKMVNAVLTPGERVRARIVVLDDARERLGLSLLHG